MLIFDEFNEALIIESKLGLNFSHEVHPYKCIDPNDISHVHSSHEITERCLEWKGLARLNISYSINDGLHCYRFIIIAYSRQKVSALIPAQCISSPVESSGRVDEDVLSKPCRHGGVHTAQSNK